MPATASSISALLSRRAQQQLPANAIAFLQKPVRWMQLLDEATRPFSAGLNFAALRRSYGLAEATVYMASSAGRPWSAARFDYDKLSAGHALRCGHEQAGSDLVSHGTPRACTVRIVDPATRAENPAGRVGAIWVHGDNVAAGYWRNPELTEHTFGARLTGPSPGTPQGPWLRTGDLGVMSDGDRFIIGRIKDVLTLVDPGSIPITTSGKVRRSTCAERNRQHQFARLEVFA